MHLRISSATLLAFLSISGCGKSPAPAPDVAATSVPDVAAAAAPDVAAAAAPDVAAAAAPDVAAAAAPDVAAAMACGEESTQKLDLIALEKSFGDLHASFDKSDWRTAPKDDEGLPGIDPTTVPKFAPLVRQLGLVDEAKDLEIGPTESAFDVYDCSFSKMELASEPGAKDTLVTIICQNQSNPDFQDGKVLYAGVVLRPVSEGTWCQVGAIVWDTFLSSRACLTDVGDGPAWKLTPIELVLPGRQALQEDQLGGLCGGGMLRGDTITRSFWGVENGNLVQYFIGLVSDASYESPCPPTEERRGKIALGETFPKVINVTYEVVCTPAEEGCDGDTKCRARKGSERHTYANGSYDLDGPEALPETAEPDLRSGTSASQFADLGRAAMKGQYWPEAIVELRKAFAVDPEVPRLRGELGWALFNDTQYAEARTLTEAALAKADKPVSKAALLYNLGRIDEAEKKTADAIAHYQASLAARPKNDTVQKRLDKLQKK